MLRVRTTSSGVMEDPQTDEERSIIQECDHENMLRFIRTSYGDLSRLDHPTLPISGMTQGDTPGPVTWLLTGENMDIRRSGGNRRNEGLAMRNLAKIVTQSGGVINNSEKIRCT